MKNNNCVPLIHIGYPKTASTWLQRRLFKPDFGFSKVLNQVEIQLGINAPTPFRYNAAGIRERFENNLSEGAGETPVISSETLSGNICCGGYNARQNADRLYETFPRAKILIVTRERKSLIRSLYKTMVEWGMPHSIDRLLSPIQPEGRFPEFNLDYLRFDLITEYYRKLFGEDNVLVIPYELLLGSSKTFAQEIVSFSGASADLSKLWKNPGALKVENSNTAISKIMFQRWFNYLFISNALNYSGMFSSMLGQGAYKARGRLGFLQLPGFINDAMERKFRVTVASKMDGQFARSNSALQRLCKFDLAELGYELEKP
jgi:hypothetical protein